MAKKNGEIKTKSENKQAIFNFIRINKAATRQDIYVKLGLSLPTIKQGIEFLEKEELIAAAEKVHNTGGRNALTYRIAQGSRYAIGIYVSLHHLAAVCVDLTGAVLYEKRYSLALDLQSDSYLRKIGELVEDVKNALHIEERCLLGVGIAIPSLVSEDGESVIYGMISNFSGITRSVLAKYIPYPVKMYHDSHAAGYAEVWQNPALKNAVYLNLNNAVGSSIILNGKLYTGNNHLSGEAGHIIIRPENGKRCYCGQKGCLYTVCSTSQLDSLTGGDLKQFFHLLDKQDARAQTAWDTYLESLALAIHNIRIMLDCSFIIGGYIGTYIGNHINELHQKIDSLSVFTRYSRTYVFPCTYQKEATAAGAAILIAQSYIENL